MLCAGLDWGKFIVGNRAYGGTPLAWSHDKDPEIHEAILAEGPAFWKTLGNEVAAPERLSPDDSRCGTCQWRKTCQGGVLMHSTDKDRLPQAEDVRPLLIEYDAVAAKFCEKLPDGSKGTIDDLRLHEIKEQIRAALGDRDAVAVAWPNGKDRKLYFRQQSGRVTWKTDDLVKAYEVLRARARKSLSDVLFDPANEMKDFDSQFPPAEDFKREGIPYRTLKIY